MNDKATKVEMLHKLLIALLETVNEAGPNGAPCGPMYAAFMHAIPQMTAEQFNQLVSVLVQAGKVRRSGHVLYAVTP